MKKTKQIQLLIKSLYNYKKKKVILNTYPIRLWIESTNICNLKCPICPNKDFEKSDLGYMDFALFKKIIDEIKDFTYDIYLHHRGEPLLNKNLIEMIKYAKKVGIKVKFHTNGTLINREISTELIDSGLDLISFSFDGFSKEPYEKIRVNADFNKTVENIIEFLNIRKEKKKTKPYTIIEEIEMPEFEKLYSKEEKEQFSQRFRKNGLDEVIYKKLYNWAGNIDIPPEQLEKRCFTMCSFLWYGAVILWDGTVLPCPQDFFGKLKMGNVANNKVKEIWNGNEYVKLRKKMLLSVDGIEPCNVCDRLNRKRLMGLPFQYMMTFLNDNIIGYGKIRKIFGSYERNE